MNETRRGPIFMAGQVDAAQVAMDNQLASKVERTFTGLGKGLQSGFHGDLALLTDAPAHQTLSHGAHLNHQGTGPTGRQISTLVKIALM
jgi:hypothetical protein